MVYTSAKAKPHRPDDLVAEGLRLLDPVFLQMRVERSVDAAIATSAVEFSEHQRAVLVQICLAQARGREGIGA